jgi:hypothetical protein
MLLLERVTDGGAGMRLAFSLAKFVAIDIGLM